MEDANESSILTDPVSSAACPKCGAALDVQGLAPFSAVQCPACQTGFQVPVRFGAFMLLQMLGAGGMGGVYRARDEALNREVAIKVMLKSLGDDPQFLETFQREAQAAARLNHRHIAQIYSFGQEKGQPYIVMELVSGGSLDKMIAGQGPLDPAAAIHIGAQIAEGLSLAADAGMVHGDIKPENILFDADKNAKLVDFGLSAMQGGPGSDVWGTPYYIAPEKVRRQKSDHRSDIYSLGGTLYHAITGVPPFEGADATAVVKARFDGPPKPMSELRRGVSPEVEALVARMLTMEPQMRFPTYGSLLGDMRRYLAKAGPVRLEKSGGKKIMLKGKHSGMTGKLNAVGAEGEPPPPAGAEAAAEAAGETEEEAGKRGRRTWMLLIAGGVALIGAVTGGVFGVNAHLKNKKAAAEHAQLVQRQDKARGLIAKSVGNAKTVAERLRGLVPEAAGYAGAAADEAVKALGEEARAGLVPPEPDYAAAAGVAPQTPAEETAGGGGADALAAAVRGMYEDAYAVKGALLLAERSLGEVEQQAAAAEGFKTVTAQNAGELDTLSKTLVERVNALVAERQFAEAPRKVTQLKRALEKVKADAASLIALKKSEAAAAEKRAQAEAEAEKKRQEQEARAQKIAAEKASVAEAEAANIEMLKKFQFREATRALREVRDTLETQEGQMAGVTAFERINRIKDFHDFLIKKAPGYKSGFGWAIDGADAKTLSVGGKKVPWTSVFENTPKQQAVVVELIRGLVTGDQAAKALGLREKTRLMTDAALCFKLFYSDTPSAMEYAKNLANDAARQFDIDAEEIKQLLPEFFQ